MTQGRSYVGLFIRILAPHGMALAYRLLMVVAARVVVSSVFRRFI